MACVHTHLLGWKKVAMVLYSLLACTCRSTLLQPGTTTVTLAGRWMGSSFHAPRCTTLLPERRRERVREGCSQREVCQEERLFGKVNNNKTTRPEGYSETEKGGITFHSYKH